MAEYDCQTSIGGEMSEAQKVKRFEPEGCDYQVLEDEVGQYVLFSDYVALSKRLREAEGVIEFYADTNSW